MRLSSAGGPIWRLVALRNCSSSTSSLPLSLPTICTGVAGTSNLLLNSSYRAWICCLACAAPKVKSCSITESKQQQLIEKHNCLSFLSCLQGPDFFFQIICRHPKVPLLLRQLLSVNLSINLPSHPTSIYSKILRQPPSSSLHQDHFLQMQVRQELLASFPCSAAAQTDQPAHATLGLLLYSRMKNQLKFLSFSLTLPVCASLAVPTGCRSSIASIAFSSRHLSRNKTCKSTHLFRQKRPLLPKPFLPAPAPRPRFSSLVSASLLLLYDHLRTSSHHRYPPLNRGSDVGNTHTHTTRRNTQHKTMRNRQKPSESLCRLRCASLGDPQCATSGD